MTCIVWFRRDLRLRDNAAFQAALETGLPILPVYVFAPDEEAPWQPGSASRWYLHQSLQRLKTSLEDVGLCLQLGRGSSVESIRDWVAEHQATHVFCNKVYEPALLSQHERVEKALQNRVAFTAFHDHSLLPPGSIKNRSGKPYRVFTPFWKVLSSSLFQQPGDTGLNPLPEQRVSAAKGHSGQSVDTLNLLDQHPWHEKLHHHWQAGEQSALESLDAFVEDVLEGYADGRDFPAQSWSSHLSAALHFGELSPWRILDTLRPACMGEWGETAAVAGNAFLRQLGWRDFAIQLLQDHPMSPQISLNEAYEGSGIWYEDKAYQQRWESGTSGIDLVDAGMAELWQTGYMHNRVRMITASLLTKNLGQHWIHGARWFWDTLVDADLANNTMGWQWVAGCGVDAAPYFRIFNPETQAQRFDAGQQYTRRWLGDRKQLKPLVDLKVSRQQALERLKRMKEVAEA